MWSWLSALPGTHDLASEDVLVRRKAVLRLHHQESAYAIRCLLQARDDMDLKVQRLALEGLRLGGAYSVNVLLALLKDSVYQVSAAEALGLLEDRRAVVPLRAMLTGPNSSARVAACKALYALKEEDAAKRLIGLLASPERECRLQAIWAVAEVQEKRAVDALRDLLSDKDRQVCAAAEAALEQLGT